MIRLLREDRRRVLYREDMLETGIPERYWRVTLEGVTAVVGAEGPLAVKLQAYLDRIEDNARRGIGLLLSGLNGTGKTAAAVIVAKEYKRRGATVLFVTAGDVLDYKIDGHWWSDDTSYWEWCREVDVLVLDDLGKGGASGYEATMWDQLLRYRHQRGYVTILTTNLALDGAGADREAGLAAALKRSTLEVLKESVWPLRVGGVNRRDAAARDVALQHVG